MELRCVGMGAESDGRTQLVMHAALETWDRASSGWQDLSMKLGAQNVTDISVTENETCGLRLIMNELGVD
jgi:hypothetical protein